MLSVSEQKAHWLHSRFSTIWNVVGSALTYWARLSTTWPGHANRTRKRGSYGPNKSKKKNCYGKNFLKNRYPLSLHVHENERIVCTRMLCVVKERGPGSSHNLFHENILLRVFFYPSFLTGRETSQREGRAKETFRTAGPVCWEDQKYSYVYWRDWSNKRKETRWRWWAGKRRLPLTLRAPGPVCDFQKWRQKWSYSLCT